jgi:hypothetical protein
LASRSNEPAYWRTKAVEFRRRALSESGDAAAVLRARAEEFAVVAAGLEAAAAAATAAHAGCEAPPAGRPRWTRFGHEAGSYRGLALVGATFLLGWAIGAAGPLPWPGGGRGAEPSVGASSASLPVAAAETPMASIPVGSVAGSEPPPVTAVAEPRPPAERPLVVGHNTPGDEWRPPPEIDPGASMVPASSRSAPASFAADMASMLSVSQPETADPEGGSSPSAASSSPPRPQPLPPARENDAASGAAAAASPTRRAGDVPDGECRAYSVSTTTAAAVGAAPLQGSVCRLPNGRWKLWLEPPTG